MRNRLKSIPNLSSKQVLWRHACDKRSQEGWTSSFTETTIASWNSEENLKTIFIMQPSVLSFSFLRYPVIVWAVVRNLVETRVKPILFSVALLITPVTDSPTSHRAGHTWFSIWCVCESCPKTPATLQPSSYVCVCAWIRKVVSKAAIVMSQEPNKAVRK